MGGIRRPSSSVSGGQETGGFIQCVNGIDPQIHKLWCWYIDWVCCEVHLAARVDILDVIDCFSENGHLNQIIGELLINGSVQFIGISQIWGRVLLYIINLWDPVEAIG